MGKTFKQPETPFEGLQLAGTSSSKGIRIPQPTRKKRNIDEKLLAKLRASRDETMGGNKGTK
jgi:hypothetical protein